MAIFIPGGENLPHLPEEVWEKILENLSTLDDLRNAANSCGDWKRILFSKRSTWQIAQVIPLVAKFLSRNDLLSLRLVCKNWKKGIDEFCSSAPHLQPYNELQINKQDWLQGNPNPYTFYFEWDWEMIDNLADKFKNPGAIIGGAVHLSDMVDFGQSVNHDNLIQVNPSSFRHQVLFLHIECRRDVNWFCSPTMVLGTIRRALETMPNLVSFVLKANFFPHVNSNEKQLNYATCFDNLVMPPLKTLQIKISYFNEERDKFFIENSLVHHLVDTLQRLEVKNWMKKWSTINWNSLSDLRISFTDDFRSWAESLCSSRIPKLKNLELKFEHANDFCTDKYLQTISKFLFLSSLKLTFTHCSCAKNDFLVVSQFINVSRVKNISINHNPVSDSFLNCFTLLKSVCYLSPSTSHN